MQAHRAAQAHPALLHTLSTQPRPDTDTFQHSPARIPSMQAESLAALHRDAQGRTFRAGAVGLHGPVHGQQLQAPHMLWDLPRLLGGADHPGQKPGSAAHPGSGGLVAAYAPAGMGRCESKCTYAPGAHMPQHLAWGP